MRSLLIPQGFVSTHSYLLDAIIGTQLHTGKFIAMFETLLLGYILAFFPLAMRYARAGVLHRMRAARSASTFAWTCVSRSFVERRTSDLHCLTFDVFAKAICSTIACLPYTIVWVGAGRYRWKAIRGGIETVLGDLTFLLAHTVFALLMYAGNRSRRICFGRGAGESALPAGRSHDRLASFFLTRAGPQAKAGCLRLDDPRRVSPAWPPPRERYVATKCTVWLERRDK